MAGRFGFAIRVELLSFTARVSCSLADRPRCVRIFRSASMFERQGGVQKLVQPGDQVLADQKRVADD